MKQNPIKVGACLSALALSASSVSAESWSFEITPYIWAPAFSATVDVGPNPPASGSTSLLDILDGAFLIFGEARRGPWTIWAEYNYLKLSDEFGSTPAGDLAAVEFTGNMAALMGGYAFLDTQQTRVEAVAGLRYWDIEATTRVIRRTATASNDWIDPLVGLRFESALSERWSVSGAANVGGFGSGSDVQWDALFSFDWSASDLIELSAGYRYMKLEFEDDSTLLDMKLNGPFIAVGFKF